MTDIFDNNFDSDFEIDENDKYDINDYLIKTINFIKHNIILDIYKYVNNDIHVIFRHDKNISYLFPFNISKVLDSLINEIENIEIDKLSLIVYPKGFDCVSVLYLTICRICDKYSKS